MRVRSVFHALLSALATASIVALTDSNAYAQSTTAKPLRWVVPYPPGGPADVIARLVTPRLSERLGQSVIIENRPGANGNIGHEAVARAAPDGTTILYVVPNIITNPLLTKGMVDPFAVLAPIARMTAQSYILLAHPGFAPQTMAEIIALARAKPGSVSCASGGGLPGFGCDWLRSAAQADFVHVLYKGNALALNDLIGGQVNLLIDLFNTALPQVRVGKVRAVALTRGERGPPLPDLPVIAETLPGFVLTGWHGVMAPAGMPAPMAERLSRAFAEALADPEVNKRISETFIDVAPTTPAQFGAILREDSAKFARIVRDAGIKPE